MQNRATAELIKQASAKLRVSTAAINLALKKLTELYCNHKKFFLLPLFDNEFFVKNITPEIKEVLNAFHGEMRKIASEKYFQQSKSANHPAAIVYNPVIKAGINEEYKIIQRKYENALLGKRTNALFEPSGLVAYIDDVERLQRFFLTYPKLMNISYHGIANLENAAIKWQETLAGQHYINNRIYTLNIELEEAINIILPCLLSCSFSKKENEELFTMEDYEEIEKKLSTAIIKVDLNLPHAVYKEKIDALVVHCIAEHFQPKMDVEKQQGVKRKTDSVVNFSLLNSNSPPPASEPAIKLQRTREASNDSAGAILRQ